MHKFLSVLLSFFILSLTPLYAQKKPLDILYVGTYSERGSKGIYVFEFDRDNSSLTELQTISDKESPTFLEIHPNGKYLYAVYREGLTQNDKNGTVTAFKIEPSTGKLTKMNEQSSEGSDPCHISLDPKGRFAYVSNYGGGNLAVYTVLQDGSLGKLTDVVQHTGSSIIKGRQEAPHVHSVIPSKDGKYIYVSDLGTDKINIYTINKSGKLSPAKKPFAESKPGSGPRHFALHPSGEFAYSAEELSSTVAAYKRDKATGSLNHISRVSMLSAESGFEGQNSAADIHISPDGKFLYASNRGQDNLAIFAIDSSSGNLTLVGHEDTKGAHPRNFSIGNQGKFIFVANRDNDNVVVFKRDLATGELSYTGEQANVPAAVCIKQIKL